MIEALWESHLVCGPHLLCTLVGEAEWVMN